MTIRKVESDRTALHKASILDTFYKIVISKLLSNVFDQDEFAVNDTSFYRDILLTGSLGFGDSYMAGKWDHPHIDELIFQILNLRSYHRTSKIYTIGKNVQRYFSNLQNRKGAKKVIEEHYDLPVEFFQVFLGPNMKYSCLDFTGTDDIETAEIQSFRKVCEKLELKSGDKVIDFGGGWGGLARFMADEYGAIPTVVNLSKEQVKYIRKEHAGKVDVLECDYRELPDSYIGGYDAVSSIAMLEAIGSKNLNEYFDILSKAVKPNGNVLIHTIYTTGSAPSSNPWLDKHIFPNGELVSPQIIQKEIKPFFIEIKDNKYPTFEELTPHYITTLHTWKNRLEEAYRTKQIKITEEEYRKWIFYFMSCAGAFKANHVGVGQFLYKKNEMVHNKRG